MKNYDIVIFGNYTKDTIISSAGTRYVDGGGFNYGAHAAVVSGLKVAAVTRLAREDHHVVDKLEQIGVDVFPVFTPSMALSNESNTFAGPRKDLRTPPTTIGLVTEESARLPRSMTRPTS